MEGYRGEARRQAFGARLKVARHAAGLTPAAAIGTTRTALTMGALGYAALNSGHDERGDRSAP